MTATRHRPRILLAIAIATSTIACAPVAMPAVDMPSAIDRRYLTAADRYVTIDGVSFRVREEGPADAPPIVLIHGFSFSLESWDGWAKGLAADHRVVRFDLAGHGLSGADPARRYGVADRVAMLATLMDRLGIKRATFAGNSFGGLLAWRLAAEQPERVDRLILVDSAAYSINGVGEKPVPVPAAMRAYLLDPKAELVAASARLIFANAPGPGSDRLVMMRDMIARPGNGEALIDHLERFTLAPPDPDLARIAAPTLILWGTADRLIPVAQAERLRDAIKGSRLILYEGVGHAPQEEIPERSLADVRQFLANAPIAKPREAP